MADAPQSYKNFPLINRGFVTRVDPAILQEGQMLDVDNVDSLQEGSLTTRAGRKRLGNLPNTAPNPFKLAKLSNQTNAGDLSLRYAGEQSDIWRAPDLWSTWTKVATGVMGAYDPITYRWALAAYSAGATAAPYGYFACPGKMLKDSGDSPYSSLQTWGISQALAAASAVNAVGTSLAISNATASGLLIDITIVAHGYSTGQTIVIAGITGTVEANGTWVVTVTGANDFTLNNSVFANAYISGGTAMVAGPDSTAAGAGEYDFVYTFRNPTTGNEGNPSAFMVSTVASQSGSITVTVWGSGDPQIPTGTAQTIVLYRRGGSFSDGIFRQVGYVTNPGVDGTGKPLSATFVDTTPDIGLIYANLAEFDNDPPVTSTLEKPLNLTIVSGSPNLKGQQWVTLTVSAAVAATVLVGSTVVIGSSTGGSANNQETCVVAATPYPGGGANTTMLVYLQLDHNAAEPVLIGAVKGQPCGIAVAAFDSVFVAADPNNPHVLYKSKAGRPESFPVITSSGISGSINVGTPSNPIMNVCEFRGKMLCLNQSNLFEVDLFRGVMVGPIETPAARGLLARWAFCKSDNAVYYLANDGVWAWDGSASRKISEPIDQMFHALSVTPFALATINPVDMTPTGLKYCRMEYYRSNLYLLVRDTAGFDFVLRYETLYDRWTRQLYYNESVPANHVLDVYLEQDSNFFIFARGDAGGGVFSQNDITGLLGSTDEFTNANGTNGDPFLYQFQTGFFLLGEFYEKKLIQDIVIELNNAQDVAVTLYLDYSALSSETFTIAAATGRRRVSFPLNQAGSPALSAGREAFAVSVRFDGDSILPSAFYAIGFRFLPRDFVQQGITSDWMDLGTSNDKKFYQLHVEHNTNGVNVVLHLDIRSGINGTTQTNDVVLFTLNSSEKTTSTLPIPVTNFPGNQPIAKLVRLRPEYSATNLFRIFSAPTFDFEAYPPDVVLFTEWEENNYPLNKYVQEILLEVDTNNIAIPLQIQADGATVQTVNVTTTSNDRNRLITLNPNLIGRQWRLFVNPAAIPSGGKFQLFRNQFVFQNADKGPVAHTFDYDDLGHPYDKALQTVTFEFDTTIGGTFTIAMDTVSGIDGNTLVSPAQTFVLPNSGRGKKTFPINVGTIVKLVRMYPLTDNIGSKVWGYAFQKELYPADTVTFTEPKDFGWPCEKVARNLILDIDTGGVAAAIAVQAEGATVQTFNITSTYTTRRVILPFNSSPAPIGKMWRLLTTPGSGGKAQIFDWSLDFTKEPCAVALWDSWELSLGYAQFKMLKQIWLEYLSPVRIIFTVIADNGNTFYSVTLPAHTTRATERFYLPDAIAAVLGIVQVGANGTTIGWTGGATFPATLKSIEIGSIVYPVSVVTSGTQLTLGTKAAFPGTTQSWGEVTLNKSKIYRFLVVAQDAATPFKVYAEASRIEWAPLGLDQRRGYQQMTLSEATKFIA